jgi:hypothetical protein
MPSVTDEMLIEALREKILREIQKEQNAQAITQNIYGPGQQVQGIPERMQLGPQEELPEDLFDYFVDITREDLPEVNPVTSKPLGWKKSVHRYRTKKGEEPPKKKRIPSDNK